MIPLPTRYRHSSFSCNCFMVIARELTFFSWQQQDGPAPTQADGSPFVFLPPAPVVLFCQSSPPLKKVIMQGQPISPKSASKSKASSGLVAPRALTQARTAVRKVAVRKTLKRKAPAQESLRVSWFRPCRRLSVFFPKEFVHNALASFPTGPY